MNSLSSATRSFTDLVDIRSDADPVLRWLATGAVKRRSEKTIPSAVDRACCAIARSAVVPTPRAVGIALPRGHARVAFTVALHLALGRLPAHPGGPPFLPFTGSVAVATADLELRRLARELRAEGSPITDTIPAQRLSAAGTYADLRSGRPGPLTRSDHFLLLHLPQLRPRLGPGVVSVSVLDAHATSAEGWEASYAWNSDAGRAQVWIGELANAEFERFCAYHAIPLLRFDWPLVESLVRDAHARCGCGALSSAALCARVGDPTQLVLRPVAAGRADELLAELEQHFASYYRKAVKLREKPAAEEPDVVRTARRLGYYLGRAVAPLATYEPIALDIPRAFRPAEALRRVKNAQQSAFHGRWKKLLTEWSAVRHLLAELYEHVRADHPKFWDLYFLLEQERELTPRRRVILRPASRTEARALELALLDHGIAEPSDFEEGGLLEVRWLGVRSLALPYGPSWSKTVTVLFEPPGPRDAGLYLSAEQGELHALLYPAQ
jgi:hypothetical protein